MSFPAGSDIVPILSVDEGVPAPLFFVCVRDDWIAPSSQDSLYLKADSSFVYTAFFADFGPLDLGLTHKFCLELEQLIKKAVNEKKSVSVYCSNNPNGHARANTAVLISAYLISVLDMSVELAYKSFYGISKPFTPYRDAAFALNTWPLFVLDCSRAFKRAVDSGHYNYKTFDLEKFEHMSQLNHAFLFAAIQISRGFKSPFKVGCQCIAFGCEANDFLKQKSQPVASQSSLPRQYGHQVPVVI